MNSSMRILHVIDSGGLYGAEKVVLSLMEEHKKNGLDVELASIAEPNKAEKAIEKEAASRGLHWRRFELRKGLDLRGMRGICKYARSSGVDVIHSHGYKPNILLALIGREQRGVAIVATLHGWVIPRFFSKMKVYQLIECALLPRLDRVVAVSASMTRGTLFAMRLGNRLKVIHNGIGPNTIGAHGSSEAVVGAREKLAEFSEGRFLIMMAGRLSPEKNFDIAIDAVNTLQQQHTPICLAIFGEGPLQEELTGQIRDLGLSKLVRLYGYCDFLTELLPQGDALLIASSSEGAPIILLEAMRARLPVVATRVGAIPEILGDASSELLVEPGNSGQIARSIGRLAREENQLSSIRDTAYERFRELFTVDRVASRYESEYRLS